MPLPERTTPTRNVAVFTGFVPPTSPEIDAPIGTTPPLSRPFGPEPMPGEPAWSVNHSRNTCACSQVVKLVVSESCGMRFSNGLAVELFVPLPAQVNGIRLLLKVVLLATVVPLVK